MTLLWIFIGLVFPTYASDFRTCLQDEARRKSRSEELQKIVQADQEDRKDWQKLTPEQRMDLLPKDLARRKRVGEIFGEGCFSTPEDYAAAALVYQHGDTPDHYFQTFIWSKRGVELGDTQQKRLMGLGLDRYLVNIGKKQLFASQAIIEKSDCWCLQQVEKSFPDQRRKETTGKTLKEALQWVGTLNEGKTCPPAQECSQPLKPTPKGSVPGFW